MAKEDYPYCLRCGKLIGLVLDFEEVLTYICLRCGDMVDVEVDIHES